MQLSNESGKKKVFFINYLYKYFNYNNCQAERQVLREKLSDLLGERVRQIIEIMDKPDYTPKLQNQNQLDTIYEADFKDIQPYLFRVFHFESFNLCYGLS